MAIIIEIKIPISFHQNRFTFVFDPKSRITIFFEHRVFGEKRGFVINSH